MITQAQLKEAETLRRQLARIEATRERRIVRANRTAETDRAEVLSRAETLDPEVLRILGVEQPGEDSLDDCPIK